MNRHRYNPTPPGRVIPNSHIANSYSFKSENNGCSIYMSNIFYGHAPLMSGLFLLNLDSSNTHVHSIEAKRYNFNNDSATYLWHCRLGHIGVKSMKKLHVDGLLESLDAANHASWFASTK